MVTLAVVDGCMMLLSSGRSSLVKKQFSFFFVVSQTQARRGGWSSNVFHGGRYRSANVDTFYVMCEHLRRFSDPINDGSRWRGQTSTFYQPTHAARAPTPRCMVFVDDTFL